MNNDTLYLEASKHKVVVSSIEDVSDQELVRLLHEIAEKGGIDLNRLIAGDGATDSDLPGAPGAKTTH